MRQCGWKAACKREGEGAAIGVTVGTDLLPCGGGTAWRFQEWVLEYATWTPWFYHLLPRISWVSYLVPLCLGFPICKMVIESCLYRAVVRLQRVSLWKAKPETLQGLNVSFTPFLMCVKLPATSVFPISHTHNQLLSPCLPLPTLYIQLGAFSFYNYVELYITENI